MELVVFVPVVVEFVLVPLAVVLVEVEFVLVEEVVFVSIEQSGPLHESRQ